MNSNISNPAAVSVENQKVDVIVDGDKVVLKFLILEEGLGWCCQKTMVLDADMADGLYAALISARIAARENNDDILSADILELDVNVL